MQSPSQHPRPAGFIPLGVFFFFGSIMAAYAAITLLKPGTFLDRAWALNRTAHMQFLPLGRMVAVPFGVLAVVLSLAGAGWFRRRYWGWLLGVRSERLAERCSRSRHRRIAAGLHDSARGSEIFSAQSGHANCSLGTSRGQECPRHPNLCDFDFLVHQLLVVLVSAPKLKRICDLGFALGDTGDHIRAS